MPEAGTNNLELVWGQGEIARLIGRTPRQVKHMLNNDALPGARKICGRWVISRRDLIAAFEAPASASVKS